VRTRSIDRLRARQRMARDRATVRACIADIQREWEAWGCPYGDAMAISVAASVLDDYLRALARGADAYA